MSVSVVIPTWNRAATLGRAIVSAACQNPAEVVVIDDASTDDTPGIVEQLQGVYPCIRYVRHREKSADWQAAAATVYPSLVGSHVICMGADDRLLPGIVESVERFPTAAVVFHDYQVANPAGQIVGHVGCGLESTTTMTPAEVRRRLREWPVPTETGIGAAIQLQWLLKLGQHQWWNMGPWSDCIAYSVVAGTAGAVYVPQDGAVFTDDTSGYGHTHRAGPEAAEYMHRVRQFLRSTNFPWSVSAALCSKRGVPYA